MLTKTRALVLRTVKYGESKLIVDLLTEEIGRVGIIANIPQSSRGRAARAFFQPLTLLDIEIDYRQTMQLQKYRNVSNLLPYTSLTINPVKTCIVMFLSEFLYHVTRDEQQNHTLFSYIVNSLEWLDAKEERFANFHLVFMMRLAKFMVSLLIWTAIARGAILTFGAVVSRRDCRIMAMSCWQMRRG